MLWQIAGARVYFTEKTWPEFDASDLGRRARPGALMPNSSHGSPVRSHDVAALLATVTSALASAEDRPGQRTMAEAIDEGLRSRRHVIVKAGTGTGKTMGYLVPRDRRSLEGGGRRSWSRRPRRRCRTSFATRISRSSSSTCPSRSRGRC
jgi:hypothetical protein